MGGWGRLLGLLDDLDHAVVLGSRQRRASMMSHVVSHVHFVVLVVRLDLLGATDNLAVLGVLHLLLDLDNHGLVHLVGHDVAACGLPVVALVDSFGVLSLPSLSASFLLSGSGTDVEFTFASDRVDAGDVTTNSLKSTVVLELPGGGGEAQIEELSLALGEALWRAPCQSSGRGRRGKVPWFLLPSVVTAFTHNETSLNGELVLRTRHGLASELLVNAGQLEEDTSGLDVRNPELDRALTGAHADFGRLLRQGAVREDVNPHLATTLDVTSHGDTSSLNLTVGDVRRLESLDGVIAERDLVAALWSNPNGSGGAACGT